MSISHRSPAAPGQAGWIYRWRTWQGASSRARETPPNQGHTPHNLPRQCSGPTAAPRRWHCPALLPAPAIGAPACPCTCPLGHHPSPGPNPSHFRIWNREVPVVTSLHGFGVTSKPKVASREAQAPGKVGKVEITGWGGWRSPGHPREEGKDTIPMRPSCFPALRQPLRPPPPSDAQTSQQTSPRMISLDINTAHPAVAGEPALAYPSSRAGLGSRARAHPSAHPRDK